MKKKIIALCLIVALAATAVIGGTLAYFTDTETAQNVFTTGNVDITLTEPKWDAAKEADPDHAKLMPGRVIDKDPTIKNVGTERAYTFMKVTLSADFIELLEKYYGENYDFVTNFATVVNDWFVLPDGYAPKLMSYDLTEGSVILGVLSPKDPGEEVVYFKGVKVPADVEASDIDLDGDYTIDITAYAIQAEGFEPTTENPTDAEKQAARAAAYAALFN